MAQYETIPVKVEAFRTDPQALRSGATTIVNAVTVRPSFTGATTAGSNAALTAAPGDWVMVGADGTVKVMVHVEFTSQYRAVPSVGG